MATQRVSIRYLIDVAIGNPEPGIVNFNALYTVLQAISAKLDLQDEHVDIDSSYCQIGAHTGDSKSHVSSERLVEHQIFDFGSDEMAEKMKSHEYESERMPPQYSASESHVPHVAFGNETHDTERSMEDTQYSTQYSTVKRTEKASVYRSELRQHIDALNARLGKIENIFSTAVEVEQKVNCCQESLSHIQTVLYELQQKFQEVLNARRNEDQSISACRKRITEDKLTNQYQELKLEMAELKRNILKDGTSGPKSILAPNIDGNSLFEDMKSEHLRLEHQLLEVKTNVCNLMEQIEILHQHLGSGDMVTDETMAATTAVHQDVETLHGHIESVAKEINRMQLEHDSHKSGITDLNRRLEELSRTKTDKEEIDELLSEKADYTMLQRKVSVENMDADRRKIQKQISELADCFLMNDERVQKQISEIRRLFGDRSLDELLYDLRVKIDREIQIVRDAVKKLAEAKPDADSAIARLRDLDCVACDQECVMKCLEMNNLSKFGNAYVSQSFSPMITFEIGKLREAGKAGLLDVEDNIFDIAKNMRHTGGMHTIITSKDRVDKVTRVKTRSKRG